MKFWPLCEDGEIFGHEAVDLVAERVERVRLGDGDDVDAVLDVELSSQVVGARLHHFQHLGNSASIQCTSTQDEMTCDVCILRWSERLALGCANSPLRQEVRTRVQAT